MTNLAITGNNPQLPDNVANTLQPIGSVDTHATGTLIEPFVTQLARQIDKAACLDKSLKSSPALDAAATDNSMDHAAKDTRDQDSIAANIPTDPANTLNVVHLQLPQERSEAAHRSATPSTGNRGTSKIDLTAFNTTLRIDSSIARPEIARPDIARPDIARPDIARPDIAKLDTADSLPGNIDTSASVSDKLTVEPFVALLARQIDKSASLNKFQEGSLAIDAGATDNSTDQVAKDARDQDAIAANIPTDPVNALNVLLLQLPQEISETAHRSVTPATGNRDTSKIDLTALNTTLRTDTSVARPDTADFLPGKIDAPASISVSLTQPTPIIAQAITSSAMSAIISNMLPNNRAADALQTIATPLGKDGWSNEFTQKISWMSSQKNQVAELHLNPPDLGPLNVVLKISDNQATAMFMSPHSAVRDAVENALPRLREILADNGIALGNATVSDQSPHDAERFMRQGSSTAAQRDGSSETSKSENVLAAAAQINSVRRHNGMVDTFA